VAVQVREQLSEVKRPWYTEPDELAGAVAAYLDGEAVEGWERREDAVARVAALKDEGQPQERVIMVSHGVLLTTWLHHEIGLDDPFRFWSDLRVPDAWQLDPEAKSLERVA